MIGAGSTLLNSGSTLLNSGCGDTLFDLSDPGLLDMGLWGLLRDDPIRTRRDPLESRSPGTSNELPLDLDGVSSLQKYFQ